MRECLKYKKLKVGHCQDDQQLDFFVMNIHGNASRKEIELSKTNGSKNLLVIFLYQ